LSSSLSFANFSSVVGGVVGGVQTLDKSKLGQFGFQQTPRPTQAPILIIFVIGGITCSEIRAIQEVAQQQNQVQVLIGSTEICTRNRLLHHLFPNLFP